MEKGKREGQVNERLLEDVAAGRLPKPEQPEAGAPLELLAERGVEAVTYTGWEALDRVEKTAGGPRGKPRVKLVTWAELLAAAREEALEAAVDSPA